MELFQCWPKEIFLGGLRGEEGEGERGLAPPKESGGEERGERRRRFLEPTLSAVHNLPPDGYKYIFHAGVYESNIPKTKSTKKLHFSKKYGKSRTSPPPFYSFSPRRNGGFPPRRRRPKPLIEFSSSADHWICRQRKRRSGKWRKEERGRSYFLASYAPRFPTKKYIF